MDDDEYLIPVHEEDMSIQQAFLRLPANVTCFAPPRMNFGTKIQSDVDIPSLLNSHRFRGPHPHWLPKSLFLLEATGGEHTGSLDHGMERINCTELGGKMNEKRPDNRSEDPAPFYMHHYVTKEQMDRSPIVTKSYRQKKDRNDVYDASMTRFVRLMLKEPDHLWLESILPVLHYKELPVHHRMGFD